MISEFIDSSRFQPKTSSDKMRNLTSTYSRIHRVEGKSPVTTVAVDAETDVVYAAREGEGEVEILRADATGVEVSTKRSWKDRTHACFRC